MIGISFSNWRKVHKNIDQFVEFCLKYSEYVVLTKRAGSAPREILKEMAEKEIEDINKLLERQLVFANTISKEKLKEIDLKDRSSLRQQFTWQANERIQDIRQMTEAYAGKEDNLKENLKPYSLADHEYKFGSFFTWPGVWDICSFSKDDFTTAQIKDIFLEDGLTIGDYDFEDIGFKDKSGQIWMKACLHEGYFEMELSDAQFRAFKLLDIPYVQAGRC